MRNPVSYSLVMPPRPNSELSTTEKEVLRIYREHIEAHGQPPSVAHVARMVGCMRNTVYASLKSLAKKGYYRERPVTETRLVLSSKGKKVQL